MTKSGFFVKHELKNAEYKYGFKQQGIFAAENIKKDSPIFQCNPETCSYLQQKKNEYDKAVTKEEILDLCEKYPDSREFILKYNYMATDDGFDYPNTFKEKTFEENCAFFNHSCDSNCG